MPVITLLVTIVINKSRRRSDINRRSRRYINYKSFINSLSTLKYKYTRSSLFYMFYKISIAARLITIKVKSI